MASSDSRIPAQMQANLARIREEFIDQVWRLLALIAAFAVPLSLLRAVGTGWLPVYALHILLGSAVWAVTFNLSRLSWDGKVHLAAGLLAATGFSSILTFGAAAPGFWWLALSCLIVSTRHSRRVTLIYCGVCAVLLLTLAFLHISGWIQLDPRLYYFMGQPGAWAAILVVVFFFTGIFLLWNHAYARALETAMQMQMEQLKQARDIAEAASQAKSEFVANMSHEIRTPMNAVLGMTHLLGQTPLNHEQKNYLDMISSSGQALLAIINDILDFSKIEAGRMELHEAPFVLEEVLDGVAGIMHAAADKELELVICVAPDTPQYILGDALRLRQILLNLVGNALKFTKQGRVSLHVGAQFEHVSSFILNCAVSDTGIGMNEQQRERLFNAFSQADTSITRQFGGTGLGLVICQRLCHMMGGAIQVQSEAGRGSTFSFQVRMQIDPGAPEFAPPQTAWPHLLAWIEQDASRQALQLAAQRLQIPLECAHDQADLLHRCRQVASGPLCVLLDSQAGAAALQQCMQQLQECAASAQSGAPRLLLLASSRERQQAPRTLSALPFVLKPCLPHTLAQGIVQAMQSSPSLAQRKSAAGYPSLKGVRILLVEDNHLNQLVACKVLRQAGAEVDVAENGELAIQALRKDSAHYAMVLMDVQMPVMDGFTATGKLRNELGLRLPVLAMSAGVMDEERAHCLQAGMDDFIAKPIDVQQMFGVIAAHLPAQMLADAAAQSGPPSSAAPAALHNDAPSPAAQDGPEPNQADKHDDSAPPDAVAPLELAEVRQDRSEFDLGDLLAWNANDAEYMRMLCELVQKMCVRGPRDLQQALHEWENGEIKTAARLLHSLRGAIGSLGARSFIDDSLQLEQDILAQQEEMQIRAGFERAGLHMMQTVHAAQAWLDGIHGAGKPD
ncbi:ATP-binding protein [Massilia sp. W12]|uniref:hybrid sensor histidine kinase/response regulator n=1 Tax=Massilia sp. W12 TaxID=3126507 RepID=UPI0030D0E3B2